MFYAEYRGARIFQAATLTNTLSDLQFSQNFKGTVEVKVRDASGTEIDMSAWTCVCGIVGGTGIPTGTPGSPELAAYNANMTYNGDAKVFSGVLDCDTTEFGTLLGESPSTRTRFAFKFIKNDGTERFEVSADCLAIAANIESGSSSAAALGPVAFTVDEGTTQKTFAFPNCPANADLQFIKLSGGPAVDYYIVNANEDDPTQNTVTVTLAGNASAGGQNFKAYNVRG